MRKRKVQAMVGIIVLALSVTAIAEVPQTYRKIWSDAALIKRIDEGIEQNRKGNAVIELVGADNQPIKDASLDIRQKSHEFLFGCNAFVLGQLKTPELNKKYEEAFAHLFNFATVPFYWAGTEPKQGKLRYQEGTDDIWRRPPPDRAIPFSKKYGITLKGHPLLWHVHNPEWLPKDPVELKRLYQKRFREIAERYAKDVAIWDVVNESQICPKSYPLYTPGKEYVAWAFNEVSPLFRPENLLMINELTPYNHGVGENNAYYRQIKQLLDQGINIEGIGFQFHVGDAELLKAIWSGKSFQPTWLLGAYKSFEDFRQPLFVTEITFPAAWGQGDDGQAEMARDYYRLWFSVPRMAGITYWDLADGTAMNRDEYMLLRDVGDQEFSRNLNGRLGGLLDKNINPKPAYQALDTLINHDWRTNLSVTTDAQGKAAFRGFYGKYTVTVAAGNATRELELDLSKDAPKTHKLIFRP